MSGECSASGSPREPEFELYDHYPLTSNDPEVTARVTAAFQAISATRPPLSTGNRPARTSAKSLTALGIPYTYWGLGGIDPALYAKAEAAGSRLHRHPGQPLTELRPCHPPHLADRYSRRRRRRAGLARAY